VQDILFDLGGTMIDAHPTLPEFEYIKPKTLREAIHFLASHSGRARPLLGGTDIFVRLRDGIWQDKYLVDIKVLEGMNELSYNPTSGLTIGAAVNMNRVITFPPVQANYPVLGEAAHSVASYQLRTRATIVGNLCNASPAGDTIGACQLLNGVLNVHGLDGVRQESLDTFFCGPGRTVLQPGDIATSLSIPVPPARMVSTYLKLGRNQASDLSIVGVTVVGFPDETSASGYRLKLALASVAPVPLVIKSVEKMLSEKKITTKRLAEAAEVAMRACTPIDDVRASARYRELMARNLSLKALTHVWEKIRREQS
jgi:carbon-monoxide dehydrogenase medium subunit